MKKLLFLAVTLLCLCSATCFAVSFTDIQPGFWAETYINELTNNGVINGYPDGTFLPDGTITKGEFIKLVMASCVPNNLDLSEVETTMDHWAAPYLKLAEIYGVVTEGTITLENINLPITRVEMVRIISLSDMIFKENDADFEEKQADFLDTLLMSYDDLYLLRHAVNRGLVTGYPDNTFKPEATMTRAEAATMIYRFTK